MTPPNRKHGCLLGMLLLLSAFIIACTPQASDEQDDDAPAEQTITSEAPVPTEDVTAEVTLEATAEVTAEATAEMTPEATTQATITFTGDVTSVTAETIVVNGLTVLIGDLALDDDLDDDATVEVVGILLETGQIQATTILIIATDDDDDDDDVATEAPEATAEATAEMTAEATAESTAEATPEATDTADVDDDAFIVVIEGPVTAINVNVITIYNFDIVLADDDPAISVLQLGDVIRIQGTVLDDDDDDNAPNISITIINITIVYVDIDVFVSVDGEVWRGDNCQNPPPEWAPANGWRARCEGGGGRGSGGGGGNDNDNDNDDDD